MELITRTSIAFTQANIMGRTIIRKLKLCFEIVEYVNERISRYCITNYKFKMFPFRNSRQKVLSQSQPSLV